MPRTYLINKENSSTDTAGYQYDASKQELQITGLVHDKAPWSVNDLAHIPNTRTIRIGKIKKA